MGSAARIHTAYQEVRRTGPGVAQQIHHAHHQLEFNLVISGRGTYFLEDGQIDLVPGTLCWLLPGQFHQLIRSPDFDTWVVTCDGDAFDADFLADVAADPCKVLSTEDAVALDRLLSHISQDLEDPAVFRAGLLYAARSARHVGMTTAGPTRKKLHPAVLKALSILRSNADTPSAGELAKMCGVNQDYLGQLLAEQTGRGFVEWRNRTRLERFHILYPESNDLLTAALAAGFGSYAQFHRVFVDLIGTTPGDWAKSGAQGKPLGIPADAGAIQAGPGGSARMVCYGLAGAAFPLVGRLLGKSFAAAFARGAPPSEVPFDSQTRSHAELRQHEPALIADLAKSDAAAAEKLQRLMALDDIFEGCRRVFPYNLPIEDLANTVGFYLMFAWFMSNRRSYPDLQQTLAIIARVRGVLHGIEALKRLIPVESQLLTAALVAQTMILRHAVVGANASGNSATRDRVSASVRASTLAMLGLDLREISLVD